MYYKNTADLVFMIPEAAALILFVLLQALYRNIDGECQHTKDRSYRPTMCMKGLSIHTSRAVFCFQGVQYK